MWSYFSTHGRACFSTTLRRSVRTRRVRFMFPSPAGSHASTASPGASQPRAARNACTAGTSPASSQGNSGWARMRSWRSVTARAPERSGRLHRVLDRSRALGVGDVVGVAGVLALDHRQRRGAAPQEVAAGGGHPRASQRAALGLELGVLAAGECLDLLRDAHAAPVVPAHRAEVGVDLEVLVMQRTRRLAVEGELELAWPVERRTRPREVVVPLPGASDAARDVAGMRGDLVGDAAGFDIVRLRQ